MCRIGTIRLKRGWYLRRTGQYWHPVKGPKSTSGKWMTALVLYENKLFAVNGWCEIETLENIEQSPKSA